MMTQVHGTCVAVEGTGVLIRGPSGSGKSDLALRLIDGGARLVADDRANLAERDGTVMISPPAEIAGLFEVRGLGIVPMDYQDEAALGLVIDPVPAGHVDRLPEGRTCEYLGVTVPLLALDPFEPSAPAKVRLAVRRLGCGTGP